MKKTFQKLFITVTRFLSRGLGLSRFKPVAWVYAAIYSRLKETGKTADISVPGVGNFKMYLDDRDSLRLSVFGIYEEFEVGLLPREITPGDIVVDVGANIGYYSIIFSKLVGAQGKVYAFEPDPVNFSILKKNIELNKCTNVVLEQKALSNKTGKITLYVSEENRGDHRIYDSGDARKTVEIEAVRLDDYLTTRAPHGVNFIKMDVQGAEVAVLEGARDVLRRSAALTMFSEFWPFAITKARRNPREFFAILKESGFSFSDINYPKHAVVPIGDTDAFIAAHSAENDGGANILAKKR